MSSALVAEVNGRKIKASAPYYLQLRATLGLLHPNADRMIQDVAGRLGRPIKYIVDVGACIGSWCITYSMSFPGVKILAIEPSKYNYPYLVDNCKDFPNVKTLKIAAHESDEGVELAGPTPVQRDMPDYKENTGLISVHGHSDRFWEKVPSARLDDLVEDRVDWLKIDIEGHEWWALQGAIKILTDHKPILQIEIREDGQRMAGRATSQVVTFLSQMGYGIVGQITADWLFTPC